MTSNNDVLTYFLTYFHQKYGCDATLLTPLSLSLYCNYRPPEGGRSLAGQWSIVRCGASQNSSQWGGLLSFIFLFAFSIQIYIHTINHTNFQTTIHSTFIQQSNIADSDQIKQAISELFKITEPAMEEILLMVVFRQY